MKTYFTLFFSLLKPEISAFLCFIPELKTHLLSNVLPTLSPHTTFTVNKKKKKRFILTVKKKKKKKKKKRRSNINDRKEEENIYNFFYV